MTWMSVAKSADARRLGRRCVNRARQKRRFRVPSPHVRRSRVAVTRLPGDPKAITPIPLLAFVHVEALQTAKSSQAKRPSNGPARRRAQEHSRTLDPCCIAIKLRYPSPKLCNLFARKTPALPGPCDSRIRNGKRTLRVNGHSTS